MRSLLARLAVLGAFALSMTACSNGAGTSLPFAGPPNNAGGSSGTIQSGGNGLSLLRFVQGSPDLFSTFGGPPASGNVDVCVDNLPFGVTSPTVPAGKASGLYSVPGGISHTVAVFPSLGGANVGLECPTAPGPYLGTPPIKVITISPAIAPAAGSRLTIVLGGTTAGGSTTLGLYVFAEPIFAIAPAGTEVIVHNASPAFSVGKPGVGFGQCTTTVTPCVTATVLTGSGNVAAPKPSTVLAQTSNGFVASSIAAIPAGFYDGVGVAAGTPAAITSIAAPAPVAGQPYVVQLYSIDGPAGGLNLVGVPEQTLGYGF
jgi:hypothetical protein